jgi:hypothetical protein
LSRRSPNSDKVEANPDDQPSLPDPAYADSFRPIKITGSYFNTIAPGRLHELTIKRLIRTDYEIDDSPDAEINMLDYQQIP